MEGEAPIEPMEGDMAREGEEAFGDMEQTGEDFGPMDGMDEGQPDGGFEDGGEA